MAINYFGDIIELLLIIVILLFIMFDMLCVIVYFQINVMIGNGIYLLRMLKFVIFSTHSE